MTLALVVAEQGNTNSASDAGVAALMARAGVDGAVLNVLINLGSVKDEAFKQACREETGQLANEAAAVCDQIIAKVRSTFA
jgi:formiminotetrahydrofolate cyclodeaminase